MATIFAVIGAHQEDPDRLIALGDDGQTYQLDLPQGTSTPIEPGDDWLIDQSDLAYDELVG